ncbi:hypothetical protein, partial [Paraburkholderia sp. J67]|uniref:hypothetical protein n=1 Tax=Paraburkholderia sp. J67 TaxID=2805435 RepID=UPI002ABD650F
MTVNEVKAAPVLRTHAFSSDIIRQLVSDIEQEPFQPSYRRVSFGAPVKGWRQRLDAYFWPRPAVGYRETCDALAPLLVTARLLADSIEKWTPELQAQAVEFADQVFAWGGVVQRTAYDWRDVHAVFASAIRGQRQDDARMNSGWTKVAAFASSHLEPEHNLVIWDSRVAHSLTQRLDAILH